MHATCSWCMPACLPARAALPAPRTLAAPGAWAIEHGGRLENCATQQRATLCMHAPCCAQKSCFGSGLGRQTVKVPPSTRPEVRARLRPARDWVSFTPLRLTLCSLCTIRRFAATPHWRRLASGVWRLIGECRMSRVSGGEAYGTLPAHMSPFAASSLASASTSWQVWDTAPAASIRHPPELNRRDAGGTALHRPVVRLCSWPCTISGRGWWSARRRKEKEARGRCVERRDGLQAGSVTLPRACTPRPAQ